MGSVPTEDYSTVRLRQCYPIRHEVYDTCELLTTHVLAERIFRRPSVERKDPSEHKVFGSPFPLSTYFPKWVQRDTSLRRLTFLLTETSVLRVESRTETVIETVSCRPLSAIAVEETDISSLCYVQGGRGDCSTYTFVNGRHFTKRLQSSLLVLGSCFQ